MSLKEIITVSSDKHTKTVNALIVHQTRSLYLVKQLVMRYWNHCKNCMRCCLCVCESCHFLTARGIHCNPYDIHYDGIPLPLPSQSVNINTAEQFFFAFIIFVVHNNFIRMASVGCFLCYMTGCHTSIQCNYFATEWMSGVWLPMGAENFSFLYVLTTTGVHLH